MRGLDVRGAVVLALVTGALGFLAAVVGGLVSSGGSSTTGIAVRAGLVTVVLLVAPRLLLRRTSDGQRRPTAAAGLLGGYVLTLGWFDGQVYAARLVLDDAAASGVVDLVLWLAVGLLALGRSGERAPVPPSYG